MAEFVSTRRSALRTPSDPVFSNRSNRSTRRVSFLPVSQPNASNEFSSTQTRQNESAVSTVEHAVGAHCHQTPSVVPRLQFSAPATTISTTISTTAPLEQSATFPNNRREISRPDPNINNVDSPDPRQRASTAKYCSFVCFVEACLTVYSGIYQIVDKIASVLVWCFAQLLFLFCSHRVMVSGVARHALSRQDLRDEQVDALLDRCACGACRLLRWWCAYCCCVCDETEDEMLNTCPLSRCMRRWTQRIGLIVCFFGSILVAYIVIAGMVGLSVSCVAGRCAFGR